MPGAQGPKVSFVVPCYKLAHVLRECVDSILAQTHRNIEVLIMDDQSPDNTGEVAASIRDRRVRYVRNERNLKNLANYNKGIDLATGKYVWLISADDRLRKPYVLERYLNVMEERQNVGYAFCPGVALEDGEETKVIDWASLNLADSVIDGRRLLYTLLERNCVLAPAGLVRKKCYDEISVFPLDMPFAGDWYLWCIFALHYDVAYFSEPMVNYRMHDLGMTNTLISQDPAIITRDDLAVRWRMKSEIEKVGDKGLVSHCQRMIVEEYAANLVSKMLRGTKGSEGAGTTYSMSLADVARSLRLHAANDEERQKLQSQTFARAGDRAYGQNKFEEAAQYYRLALAERDRRLATRVKLALVGLGMGGRFIRRGVQTVGQVSRTFRNAVG